MTVRLQTMGLWAMGGRRVRGLLVVALFTAGPLAPAMAQQSSPPAQRPGTDQAQTPPGSGRASSGATGSGAEDLLTEKYFDLLKTDSLANRNCNVQVSVDPGIMAALKPAGPGSPLQAAQEKYAIASLEHRTAVFAWQLSSAKVIFVMVMLLVVTGIYMSWAQFERAAAVRRPAKEPTPKTSKHASGNGGPSASGRQAPPSVAKADSESASEATGGHGGGDMSSMWVQFKASKEGLDVRTSVIGVIILIVSLAFFYLYVVTVFPIAELK